MPAFIGQLIDFALGHWLVDFYNQSIYLLDLLGFGLAADGKDFLLGLLRLWCGLGFAFRLGFGFLGYHDGLGPLFPNNALAAVLQIQQLSAVSFKRDGFSTLVPLGQKQFVAPSSLVVRSKITLLAQFVNSALPLPA